MNKKHKIYERPWEHSVSWASYRFHFMRSPKEYLSVAILSNYDGFDSKKYANDIAKIALEKVTNNRALICNDKCFFSLDNYFTNTRDVCGYIYFWDT